jgi:maltose O-acetyltransferase
MCRKLRYLCCRNIFAYCGKNVNIERKAFFGNGFNIRIGDNSGIGMNCHVPNNIQIGADVMMADNCYILGRNHKYERVDIPMIKQGSTEKKQTIIENDVWIGRDVLFTPGRVVKTGSIIAAGCVLHKDFPAYSVIGGNPSTLIKVRKRIPIKSSSFTAPAPKPSKWLRLSRNS